MNKTQTYKLSTIIGGVLTAGLLTTNIITKDKLNTTQEDRDTWRENFIENDSMRVAEYKGLVKLYNDALYESNKKDSLNKKLDTTNNFLKNKNKNLNQEIATLTNKYEQTTDSMNEIIQQHIKQQQKLKGIIRNDETVIDFMKDDITHKNKLIEQYNKDLINAENLQEKIQHHLNAYIITRRPIKERQLNKTYIPTDTTLTPLGRCEVREIRKLNKEYKQTKN